MMNKIFQFREKNYNILAQTFFTTTKTNAVKRGIDLLRLFAVKVWSVVLQHLKCLICTEKFKRCIEQYISSAGTFTI